MPEQSDDISRIGLWVMALIAVIGYFWGFTVPAYRPALAIAGAAVLLLMAVVAIAATGVSGQEKRREEREKQ